MYIDLYFAVLISEKMKVDLIASSFSGYLLNVALVQPFIFLAKGRLWLFHLSGNNRCYVILCYVLPMVNVLNLFLHGQTQMLLALYSIKRANMNKSVAAGAVSAV